MFHCRQKPSLQVWGGNTYSGGSIATAEAKKKSLAGYAYYTGGKDYAIEGSAVSGKPGLHVFGSWGELGVLANGKVSGFTSGASLGYGNISGGTLSPNPYATPRNGNPSSISDPGGSTTEDFCSRVPLSFANNPCDDSTTGSLGSNIMLDSLQSDEDGIVTRFDFGNSSDGGTSTTPSLTGEISLNNSAQIKGTTYYYYGHDLVIPSSTDPNSKTIARGTIQLVHSTNNIFIRDNIAYENGYKTLSEVPKLIIYADNNINIGCNVTRVDAVLIAKKTVTTCANADNSVPNINSAARSKQLVINGAIMAGKLTANRTYGAATGANSIIPAEIINFDTTLYRWGESSPITDEEGNKTADTYVNLDVASQKELAPRL